MNIVLIGASGFLGLHTVQALAAGGHHCTVLTRQAIRRGDFKLLPNTRLLQADVYDEKALAKVLSGADAVVSMAGILNEKGFSGAGFRRVHVDLVKSIIAACELSGVQRVVHISALNAGVGSSHYLQSKGEAEQALKASNLDVTLLQPSVIFGPGDSFFNRFSGLLTLAPVLPLACPGSRLQPVFVGDVANVICRVIDDPEAFGETFQLGGPDVFTLQQLVRWTAEIREIRRWIPGLPAPLSRLQAMIMDFVPGKPFSSDNYASLQVDNVVSHDGFKAFGIKPASIYSQVPFYLGMSPRQRRLRDSRKHRG